MASFVTELLLTAFEQTCEDGDDGQRVFSEVIAKTEAVSAGLSPRYERRRPGEIPDTDHYSASGAISISRAEWRQQLQQLRRRDADEVYQLHPRHHRVEGCAGTQLILILTTSTYLQFPTHLIREGFRRKLCLYF